MRVHSGSVLSSGGFTLVELLIAVVVMMVALLGTVGTIGAIGTLGQSNEQSSEAYQAARSMIESLHSQPFGEVFARFNDDPGDDPGGNGTAPGAGFAVPGLQLQEGDADGLAGRILMPVGPGTTLREDTDDPRFGLPMDLNGDGVIDGDDHGDDYILLPVRVRVEWTGRTGDRFFEYSTLLGRRE